MVETRRLENDQLRLAVIDYGARVVSLQVNNNGNWQELVVSPRDHRTDTASMGATVGRYANRIAGGRFHLDGRLIEVDKNHGKHHLHGGSAAFGTRPWQCVKDNPLTYHLISEAGEGGFPGRLSVSVSFELKAADLVIEYEATTDATTVVNLTNHTYFNLGDHTSTVDAHRLQVNASSVLAVDDELIPTGALQALAGHVLDFRESQPLADALANGGIDHCFVLSGEPAATLKCGDVSLTVITTEPGLQVYTANFLEHPHTAVCIETQHFPDSPNHPQFPSTVLRPGDTFTSRTIYRVGVE